MDKETQFVSFLLGVAAFFLGLAIWASGGSEILGFSLAAPGFLALVAFGSMIPESEKKPRTWSGYAEQYDSYENHYQGQPASYEKHHFGPYTEGVEFRTEKPDGTVVWERRIRRWD